jgi:hypothetical protein
MSSVDLMHPFERMSIKLYCQINILHNILKFSSIDGEMSRKCQFCYIFVRFHYALACLKNLNTCISKKSELTSSQQILVAMVTSVHAPNNERDNMFFVQISVFIIFISCNDCCYKCIVVLNIKFLH